MKKIFSIICLCLMCVFASAQVVETGSLKDNWYVSGNVGTTIWDNSRSWTEPHDVLVNIAVGKEITPIFGLELDMMAGMNQGSKTFFDSHNLTANVTTNLTNLICGYEGSRRLFEPVLLIGAGWYHTYGDVYNNVSARGAIRCNFNITDSWALNVTPEYMLLPKTTPLNHEVNVYIGATYRFKSNKGNFPMMKLYSDAEVESLNAAINELRAKNSELESRKPVEIIKTDTIVVTKVELLTPKIQFLQNSSEISTTSNVAVSELAAYISNSGKSYMIEGYASEEGPVDFNNNLAVARAESMKKALISYGAPEDKLIVKGCGSTTEFGDREFNRIVIVTEQ